MGRSAGFLKIQDGRPKEHNEQVTVIQWCDWQYKQYADARKIFAIPNGGYRNIIVATRLKAEGVRAGVPDLFLPVARQSFHGLFIEMKRRGAKAQANQLERLRMLNADGYCAVICHGADEAIETIKLYLDERIIKHV